MSVFLHIGWPKTATSSLQVFFAQNSPLLNECGVWYPEMFDLSVVRAGRYGQGNAYPLAYELLEDKTVTACGSNRFDLGDLLHLLKSEEADKRVLLSSEWFSELSTQALRRLKTVCASAGHDVKIVAYMRPYLSYLDSEYAQQVKMGYVEADADSWLNFGGYSTKLQNFLEVFGADSISLRKFGKSYFLGGSVFSDFLAILGISLKSDSNFRFPPRMNVRLFPYALNFQRELLEVGRRLTVDELEFVSSLLFGYVPEPQDSEGWLTRKGLEKVLPQMERDIEWLEENGLMSDCRDFLLQVPDEWSGTTSLNHCVLDAEDVFGMLKRFQAVDKVMLNSSSQKNIAACLSLVFFQKTGIYRRQALINS